MGVISSAWSLRLMVMAKIQKALAQRRRVCGGRREVRKRMGRGKGIGCVGGGWDGLRRGFGVYVSEALRFIFGAWRVGSLDWQEPRPVAELPLRVPLLSIQCAFTP